MGIILFDGRMAFYWQKLDNPVLKEAILFWCQHKGLTPPQCKELKAYIMEYGVLHCPTQFVKEFKAVLLEHATFAYEDIEALLDWMVTKNIDPF